MALELKKRLGLDILRAATPFKEIKAGETSPKALAIGRVDKLTEGKSDLGEYVRLDGAFQIIGQDDDKWQGKQMFLPEAGTGAIVEAVMASEDAGALEFGFWIWRDLKESKDGGLKGFWHCEPATKITDPFAQLVAELKAKETPVPKPKTEPKAEPEKAKAASK